MIKVKKLSDGRPLQATLDSLKGIASSLADHGLEIAPGDHGGLLMIRSLDDGLSVASLSKHALVGLSYAEILERVLRAAGKTNK